MAGNFEMTHSSQTKDMITLKEKIQDLLYGSDIGDDPDIYRWEAEQILKLVIKEIKRKLPTHKGKMLSRKEVKDLLDGLS